MKGIPSGSFCGFERRVWRKVLWNKSGEKFFGTKAVEIGEAKSLFWLEVSPDLGKRMK